jgi:hypothetical protein
MKLKNIKRNEPNENSVSERFTEPLKLKEEEKKKLQVKDGQHNHHVDERGGAS